MGKEKEEMIALTVCPTAIVDKASTKVKAAHANTNMNAGNPSTAAIAVASRKSIDVDAPMIRNLTFQAVVCFGGKRSGRIS